MPYGITDPYGPDPLEKFSHHFSEGQRVRLKDTGHRGKILTINRRGNSNVRLDSGHMVECHPHEIEPEDFPSGGSRKAQSGADLTKYVSSSNGSFVNPYGVDDGVNTFGKRWRPSLRVGQKVRDSCSGQVGIVQSIEGQMPTISHDNGETFVLMSPGMTIIPIES